jgi:hypothetical protein
MMTMLPLLLQSQSKSIFFDHIINVNLSFDWPADLKLLAYPPLTPKVSIFKSMHDLLLKVRAKLSVIVIAQPYYRTSPHRDNNVAGTSDNVVGSIDLATAENELQTKQIRPSVTN